MKKLFTLVAVASISALVACGPSAEEKQAMEKAKQDSIAAVEAQKAAEDAAKAQAAQDSTNQYTAAQEAEAKRIADSTEAASKGGKKK
jgi:outer membrane phospholipase A